MHHGILGGKQDGGCTEDNIDAFTYVVGNSCNLVTESSKPLIHRDNSLRKVNLTFKCGFGVIKLSKNYAVIHLPPDSVLDVETGTSNVKTGWQDRSHLTFTGLRFSENKKRPQS